MKKFILASGLTAFIAFGAQAQFTPGNLAVLRAGDGVQLITNIGNSVFIDQYTTAGTNTAPVNSAAVPNSGASALIEDGSNGSEGGLTRSMDRTMLAIAGYNTNLNSAIAIATSGGISGTTSAQVSRNIATVDAFGSYNMVELASGDFTKQNPRFVVADGTNNFWAIGGASGIVYLNPPSGNVAINSSVVNNRAMRIVGGNLYFSSQKVTPTSGIGLYTFTSTPGSYTPAGLAKTASIGTNLVFATGASSAISDFALNPAVTVAYVADTKLGIQKWVNTAGIWSLAYTFALASAPQPAGAFGVVADFSGANPVIYATTTETNSTSAGNVAGNHLVQIVDTNSAATITCLAQAPAREVLKGIDFTPDLRPLIVSQPQGQTVTNQTPSVGITVSATSPFALSYQWQKNGTNITDDSNISGSATATLNFANAVTTNSGNYTVIITNQYSSQFGAITSAVATLTVNTVAVAPAITAQPLDQTNLIGGTASFTVAASGTPTPVYQWQEIVNGGVTTNILAENSTGLNGEIYTGTTNATLFISGVQTNDSGNYYQAVAVNSAGTTNSRSALLTVVPVPPGIIIQPAAQAALLGQTARFQVAASGSYLGYQWMYVANGVTNNLPEGTGSSGENFAGTQTAALEIDNVQTNDAGYYIVAVTNSVGATNSQPALLTVVVVPPPSYISYATEGAAYTQNFDSLPNLGANYTNTVKASNPVLINGTNYSLGTVSPGFDFATPILTNGFPGGLGLSNTMSGWYGWAQGTSGSNTNYFGANAGDYTTGGIQDFGSTNSFAASTNRALGLLTTGSFGPAAFAARFINNTPDTLTNMTLQFTGELWRQSDLPKTLAFHYVIDLTGTNTFDTDTDDYAYLNNFDVTFSTDPTATGGVQVDGTLPVNQSNISVTGQMIADWPPGAALWLVWEYTDTTGKAQGIGIDNLSFSATSQAVSAGPILPLTITPGSAQITGSGASATAQFTFTNTPGLSFSILATNDITAPKATWPVIGTAVEGSPGHYQFTDPNPATNSTRFYILRQP